MPVSYKIFAEKKLVVVSYSGDLLLEEILNARKEGAADPDFNPAYNVIDDISAVSSSTINFNEISRISTQSVAKKGVRRALVAQTDVQRGMAHMYQVMSESSGHMFKIFNDYDSAYEWIISSGEDE